MKFSPHAEGGVRAYQPKRRLAELDMKILSIVLTLMFFMGVLCAAWILSRVFNPFFAALIFALVCMTGLFMLIGGLAVGGFALMAGLCGALFSALLFDEEGGSL